MTRVFQQELELLKQMIMRQGGLVRDQVELAIRALRESDADTAREVMDRDQEIDRLELEIERECLRVLALFQPVAADLFFVVAVMRIAGDLERMGDTAVKIAKRVVFLCGHPMPENPVDLNAMSDLAVRMVERTLEALANQDPALAREVCGMDDGLDQMRRDGHDRLVAATGKSPEHSDVLAQLLAVVRHHERLGDMAVNVAQEIIFMVEGEVARH